MTDKINLDTLTQLFAQIEQAWVDRHDRALVYQLSEEYPQFRGQLYEFFEDIVLEAKSESTPEFCEADDRLYQWLQSSAIQIAIAAAQTQPMLTSTGGTPVLATEKAESKTSSSSLAEETKSGRKLTKDTWVLFLRRRTNQSVPNLTKALTNITTEYLVMISRHPNIVPQNVKVRIAKDIEETWGVPSQESIESLIEPPPMLRAASRSRPFEKEPTTFEELLDRSALSPQQKTFWLLHAKTNT